MKDLVTVVMPCYNMGNYISQALEGVASQTYINWEVIVVDDCGPSDGFEDIVLDFKERHKKNRVKLIRHQHNRGVCAARNTAIDYAKGAFIAPLDPDDYWMPNHLETAVSYFLADRDLYFYSCFANIFYLENDSRIKQIERYMEWELRFFPYSLALRNAIPNSSAVLRRAVFEEVGYYDENKDIHQVGDYDLWIRIIKSGLKTNIHNASNIFYRKHPTGATSNMEKMIEAKSLLVKKHQEWFTNYRHEVIERLSGNLITQDIHITKLKNKHQALERRIAVLEQTIAKLKSLPILKQILGLKNSLSK